MSYAFQINPREVLGVSETASLTELREAYRTKSKKHHPDVGGDEWAFRILTKSYEVLSTARVMGRADEEMRREESSRAARASQTATSAASASSNPFARVNPNRAATDHAQARTGVRDNIADTTRLVAVDLLLIRYELESPLGLLMGAPEDRNLSCTLSLSWPASELTLSGSVPRAAERLKDIQVAFDAACQAVAPLSQESRCEESRFEGMLSYATAIRADQAFKVFRKALSARGLGVFQTIRDVTIPREWRQ